jgi:colicin import membrane protein
MKQSLHIGTEPTFHKIVIASAVLHLLFIVLVSVPVKTKEKEFQNYFVSLVGPAEVQRTVRTPRAKETVPSKTVTEKKATKEKETLRMKSLPQKREAPGKGVSLEPEKSFERVSREIERLQALKALSRKKIKKDEQIEKGREADEEVARAIEIIRKNKTGDASRGPGFPGARPSEEVNLYIALVQQKIWDEWIHPEFSSEDLAAVISFQIDRKGNIISPEIVKSSGNDLFDRSAMKAILKAGPLPPPVVEDEFEVRFHL